MRNKHLFEEKKENSRLYDENYKKICGDIPTDLTRSQLLEEEKRLNKIGINLLKRMGMYADPCGSKRCIKSCTLTITNNNCEILVDTT